MTLEGDDERDIKIREIVKSFHNYDSIIKRWDSASRMRLWLMEKKKNLADKVKKQVTDEFKKKKKEDEEKAEKAKEEKPSDESKPKEDSEENKDGDDKPVSTDEITMIDTSSSA